MPSVWLGSTSRMWCAFCRKVLSLKKITIFQQYAQYTISKNNPEVLISETDFPESLISCAGAVLGLLLLLRRQAGIFYDDSLSVNVNTSHLLLLGRTRPAQQLLPCWSTASPHNAVSSHPPCARAGSGQCHQTSTAAGSQTVPSLPAVPCIPWLRVSTG